MPDIRRGYGTANQPITITINGLGSGAYRSSAAVDNGTDKFLDALVMVTLVTTATAPSVEKAVYVYAYGTVDGTTYTDGVTGVDEAPTAASPPNYRLIGVVSTPAASTTYRGGAFSVASGFGGVLPAKWGIVVRNVLGTALGTGCSVAYQGVYAITV